MHPHNGTDSALIDHVTSALATLSGLSTCNSKWVYTKESERERERERDTERERERDIYIFLYTYVSSSYERDTARGGP